MCEISVIIPIYNKIDYLVDTVKCVLAQTYTDYELLLIDDGSTDGSGDICDYLAEKDERINVVHTTNHGVGAARNLGIKKASGKYISFIDADDRVDKRFLEKLYKAITDNDAGMAVCEYFEEGNGKKKYHRYKSINSGNEIYEVLSQDLLCIIWNKLFVRKKIKHLFDEHISTCEDSIFCTMYYFDNKPKVACVNEVLYGYVVRYDGLTSNLQKQAYEGINNYLKINRLITEMIDDEEIKKLTIHHVYRVYYYGIYLFIYRNLIKGKADVEKLAIIEEIINDKKYQRIIRFMLIYSFRNIKAERTSCVEFLIIMASVLKCKKAVYYITKVRQCPEIANHL